MKRKGKKKPLKFSSSSSQQQQSKTLYLPDECWESICTFLIDGDDNFRYFEHLSLASKQLLSITNRLRFSVTIFNTSFSSIIAKTLFRRFPNLTSLHLTSLSINSLLCEISKFPFKLKSLKLTNSNSQSIFPASGLRALSKKITTLTSLTCFDVPMTMSNHFYLISDCFPSLEEIDLHQNSIHDQINPDWVEAMLTSLPKLRKINLSGCSFLGKIRPSLLLHLCKNCEFLEEVVMLNSQYTPDSIASAICQRPTLRSLSLRWSQYRMHGSLHFIDSLLNLKGLTCLELVCSKISDELLCSIAMGGLPLRKLVLQYCTGYGYAGIFSLLSNCRCIQHLDLENAMFLNDLHIVKLSLFLRDLVFINLSECSKLTDSALLALVRNCLSLSDVKMVNTRIGENTNSNSLTDFVLNPQLKSLYLTYSSWLKDESLIMFASIYPNLHILDLSCCNDISEEGICQVLKRCCKIRHLNLFGCNVEKLFRLDFKVPKLEVLNLSYTKVDDKTLYVISKNCSGILQLLLKSCKNVTKKGVMHVVENCEQLREIDIQYCDKVCHDIFDNMVCSRPSLRKITAPPHNRLSDKKRELLKHCGCLFFFFLKVLW